MATNNELEQETSKEVKLPTLSPESYDADTPSLVSAEGYSSPMRIAGVGGTEIGAGSDAEYFRDGLYSIFGGAEVEASTTGKGVFGRDIGNLQVEGIDWRHLLYEVGVSDRWTNYGYDEKGSDVDERYKWYAGQSQSTNIDAYKLLEEAPQPNEIISDEDFSRIELLRKSLKTHMGDAQQGVLDKDQALLIAKELMSKPELLTLAQKRRWYEKAQNSNVAAVMLANWNDPLARSDIESQGRVTGMDVTPRVDTSYWAMAKNALQQQHGVSRDNTTQINNLTGWTSDELDEYITTNEISPDIAADMYDAFEVRWWFRSYRSS